MKDELRDHAFDGIQEFDNPLPRWWLYSFYASIVFAGVYLIYYHMAGGASLADELQAEVAAQAERAATAQQAAGGAGGGDLKARIKDAAFIAAGKATFDTTCAPCHGAAGEGGIGPNLTDKYWLHGGTIEAVQHTIAEGVPEKGMPAWKPVLGPAKVDELAAYVLSLVGTQPPNPKAPQGEPVETEL